MCRVSRITFHVTGVKNQNARSSNQDEGRARGATWVRRDPHGRSLSRSVGTSTR